MTDSPIIDRSPAQKAQRINDLRIELKALGYSIVPISYLAGLLLQAKRIQGKAK